MKLEGRVAAITAGTRSIGRAIADRFLVEGASLVVNGRSTEKGARCLEEMGAGDRACFFPGSATEKAIVEGLIDFTVERYGRIDIIVLNAGGVERPAPIVSMSDEEWQFELNLNLNHVFWGMRRALQHMVTQGSGRVIAMSSIEGKQGKPGLCGYTATKHAINGLVKAVAREVGESGITVNAICPGLVVTDIVRQRAGRALGLTNVDELVALYTKDTALKRAVTGEEVAALAVLLASDEGAAITGGTISIDGGAAYY